MSKTRIKNLAQLLIKLFVLEALRAALNWVFNLLKQNGEPH